MLLNEQNDYLRDDIAIFGLNVSADNDTRAPSAFIWEQNWIIGNSADGLADAATAHQVQYVSYWMAWSDKTLGW